MTIEIVPIMSSSDAVVAVVSVRRTWFIFPPPAAGMKTATVAKKAINKSRNKTGHNLNQRLSMSAARFRQADDG